MSCMWGGGGNKTPRLQDTSKHQIMHIWFPFTHFSIVLTLFMAPTHVYFLTIVHSDQNVQELIMMMGTIFK